MSESSSLAGGQTTMQAPQELWQDRDIKFDSPAHLLELRRGEFVIDKLLQVEDTKGNNGDKGTLTITNLRMIWQSDRKRKCNLSIGFAIFLSINIKTATSRLRGHTKALYILTRFNGSRFEFIFTNLVKDSPRLFTSVQAVSRAYDMTRPYRDVKIRSAVVDNNELALLDDEQILNKFHGVWNLSDDRGHLGTFVVTNVRIVWFANLSNSFNVSLPYVQVSSIRIRESKLGTAIVIEVFQKSGGYILGFRIDPIERLQEIADEVHAMHQIYAATPIFGLTHETVLRTTNDDERKDNTNAETFIDDDVNIVDTPDRNDVLSLYCAEGAKLADREPVYNAELGLAVERLRDDYTISQLWNVMP